MITGETVIDRKKSLASIVKKHLLSLGETASIVENRLNSKGHTDRVLIKSSVGLIHLVASVNEEPNGRIPTSDFQGGSQDFLADKDFVAYGWNTKDKRTMVMFVPIAKVLGNKSLSKNQIRSDSVREYTFVLKHNT